MKQKFPELQLPVRENYGDRTMREANETPIDIRQKFLDLMWSGKTLGDAREELDLTFEAANGIMLMNIQSRTFLNKETA